MRQLDEMRWEAFRINELFEIETCSFSGKGYKLEGKTPYVGATHRNNGVLSFLDIQDTKQIKGNCIVFICNGDGSIGLSVYRYSDFVGSVDVKIGRSKHLNPYVGMFITTIADKVRPHYSFGYKRTLNRLRAEHIMLPVSAPHTPDYAYMEEYMRNKEKEMLTKYQMYLDKHIVEKRNEDLCLDSRRWKEFYIGEVFTDILRGKRLKTDDHIEGSMPYVSSSSQNNGIDNFVSNKDGVRIFDNCLSLANSGSVGETFYHQYDFVASDHVTKLANKSLDKYTYLFISSIVRRIAEKYSFNREINDKRLGREKIMLPVTSSSIPDYAFMSQYMQNIELKHLKSYIDKRLSSIC